MGISYNVMVVDDNRIMREIVSRTVRMSGLPVADLVQAAHGQEALDLMRSRWIDLVLLDINMPVMNGEEFLAELRSDTALRSTLVVVVSTESSQSRIARLQALGAGFVHKPFTPEALVAEVERLVALPVGRSTP